MAYRLIWSPIAESDLRAIMAYFSEDDPAAARKFIRSIISAVERLPFYPSSGRIVPEYDDLAIREIIRPPCRIVYRANDRTSTIEILRVWHAARGIPDIGSDG